MHNKNQQYIDRQCRPSWYSHADVLSVRIYSQNHVMTSGSLWYYYRDEINDVDDNAWDGKSFKYKTKIIGKTEARP